MSEVTNRMRYFDLKVGDRIIADCPYIVGDIYGEQKGRMFTYIVTEIHKHIFMAECPTLGQALRRRCFNKADYMCGIVNRKH